MPIKFNVFTGTFDYVNTSGSGGFTILEKTSGAIDNSNTVFGFSQLPTFIVVGGIWYRSTTAGGTVNWTWNAGTLQATLSGPVGTAGEVFGVLNSGSTPSTSHILTEDGGILLTEDGNDLTQE